MLMIKLCRNSIHNELCKLKTTPEKVPSSNLITSKRNADKVTETNFAKIKGCGLSLSLPKKSQQGNSQPERSLNTPLTDAKPVKGLAEWR